MCNYGFHGIYSYCCVSFSYYTRYCIFTLYNENCKVDWQLVSPLLLLMVQLHSHSESCSHSVFLDGAICHERKASLLWFLPEAETLPKLWGVGGLMLLLCKTTTMVCSNKSTYIYNNFV